MKDYKLNDSGVIFDEPSHTYSLNGRILDGITKTLLATALPEEAERMAALLADPTTAKVVNDKRDFGSRMHKMLEDYQTGGNKPIDVFGGTILNIFLELTKGREAVACEYNVTDGDNFASNIDLVMDDDEEGFVNIYDYKFTYDLHDESICWQASIYADWFERQNPHLKVRSINVIWIPISLKGENKTPSFISGKQPKIVTYPRHSHEEIEDLTFHHLMQMPYKSANIATLEQIEKGLVIPLDLQKAIALHLKKAKEVEQQDKELKARLKDWMIEKGVTKIDNDYFKATLSPTTKKVVNTDELKEEHPSIYKKYITGFDEKQFWADNSEHKTYKKYCQTQEGTSRLIVKAV